MKDTFHWYSQTGSGGLKSEVLNHGIVLLDRFGWLHLLSSSAQERIDSPINRAYRSAPQRRTSVIEEILPVADINTHKRRHTFPKTRMTKRGAVLEELARVSTVSSILIKDGWNTTVHCIETALQKKRIPKIAEEVVNNVLTTLEADTTLAIVSILN